MNTTRPLRGAIVIGSEYRQLGIIRSLGRHGVPVWVLHGDHWLGAVSRYARRRFVWPKGSDAERLDFLIDLSRRHGLENWALFPGGDQETALIAQHHRELSELYVLTTPPWSVLRPAHDKRATYRLAAELGIAHPWTYHPVDRADLERLACGFPVILKPAMKEEVNALTAAKAWRVNDRDELLARYDVAASLMDPALIMVQELIGGGGEAQFSYAALCDSGRPVASIVARRTRQWPVDFGRSSTFVETIDLPPVAELGERVTRALGFSGLIEVEFKRDANTGSYKLLDINPRIWGWHTVGRAAGVDFPFLTWELFSGRTPSATVGRPGARWVHAVTDAPMALVEIARGRLGLLDYLRSLRPPIETAVFALDDPLPALIELPMVLYLLWNRREEFASLVSPPLLVEERR
jgi:D-aspartate ligase